MGGEIGAGVWLLVVMFVVLVWGLKDEFNRLHALINKVDEEAQAMRALITYEADRVARVLWDKIEKELCARRAAP